MVEEEWGQYICSNKQVQEITCGRRICTGTARRARHTSFSTRSAAAVIALCPAGYTPAAAHWVGGRVYNLTEIVPGS